MDAIGIAASGLNTHQAWLNAISDNLANMNDVSASSGTAFQAEYIQASADPNGNGVVVDGVQHGSSAGKLVYSPDNPLADKQGYVRMPDIDMSAQMGDMVMAQRGYEANAAVVTRAKSIYEAALQIGKS
jgi:flagellar basal-body rod protein FlgC